MIRFPERFHASNTPGAHLIGVDPNYLAEPAKTPRQECQLRSTVRRAPRFDFTAIVAALGE